MPKAMHVASLNRQGKEDRVTYFCGDCQGCNYAYKQLGNEFYNFMEQMHEKFGENRPCRGFCFFDTKGKERSEGLVKSFKKQQDAV